MARVSILFDVITFSQDTFYISTKRIQWLSLYDSKSLSFNDAGIDAVGRNDHRTHFWFLTEIDAVDRLKNVDLIEKKWTAMIIKRLFSIVMLTLKRLGRVKLTPLPHPEKPRLKAKVNG